MSRVPTTRRRGRLAGLLLAAALALPAGCGSGPSAAPPRPLDDGRPLVVASGADLTTGSGAGIRSHLIDRWNADPHHRKAVLVELPWAADGQHSELVGALQSGAADYDVVNLDITWIPEFAAAGLIRPLPDTMVDSGFLPAAAATSRWQGRTYAVPFNSDVGLLYYRTADLAEVGLKPADLGGYASVGDLLSVINQHGRPIYTTQLREYEGLTVNTLEAFWDAGADLVDAKGRYIGTDNGLRKGLEALRGLGVGGTTDQRSLDADESDSLAMFVQGKQGAGMLMRNWPYAFNRLDAGLPPGTGFGVTRLPGVAALGGQSLAVTTGSDHPDDARELIRFLTGDSSERALLDAGLPAARTSAYDPRGITCGTPSTSSVEVDRQGGKERSAVTAAVRRRWTEVLWCALRQARARPASTHYVPFSRVLQREAHRFLLNPTGTAEQQAVDDLPGELGKALGGR
ncbi:MULTISPECIES: extracellular solute-binding protein [Streptomycetaceae]|uniref:Extracellular solute-binding protein family 1 n=1 Tax=Streptantibioticus cattleyicolor (strain ATCC 35852 / DSM 46488 / JCM 4925 / NBRC 14057 / NRRL 8057) TaxID=1003195 RepID=F8JWG5_STREN|nr:MULTISPECIES: extracellular solute-binding protein [Streptomycetaceae]AEW95745.1 extracellular solute-binding protein family 1 [Streptantibioticus cattleyicolor NRRL 8057 = DSM 46488]MYS60290.1 extracellular solute-binding protein [Streptomyces sp. SID5468]CCB76085.1 putative Carbohydrate ABC transporter substrate-binding protein, CUT1 family [Streptantibioticus cattleyicolor NRRL 8057 = DSM 46488]